MFFFSFESILETNKMIFVNIQVFKFILKNMKYKNIKTNVYFIIII